jgi:trimeric autotransporter adhesin
MAGDYPKKYWWLILVVIPIALAVIQIYPELVTRKDGGTASPPPPPAAKPTVREIATHPDRMSLQVGDTSVIRAELRDEQGATLGGYPVEWRSSNAAVATVSPSGRVTAVAEGVALTSAGASGALASTEVTVLRVPLAQIRVLPEKYSILAGTTLPLKAELRDKRGNLVDRTVTWRSENTKVAYVTETGVVKGMSFGITEIVAASEGVEGRAKVFIGNPQTGLYPVEIRR